MHLPSHPSCFLVSCSVQLVQQDDCMQQHSYRVSLLCRWRRPWRVYTAALTGGRGSCDGIDLLVLHSAHCSLCCADGLGPGVYTHSRVPCLHSPCCP